MLENAHRLAICIALILITSTTLFGQGRPLIQAEFNIYVDGSPSTSIVVDAVGNVWGQRSADFPLIDSLHHLQSTGTLQAKFIDRGGSYEPPFFAYGIYRITVSNHSIFVDFRDNDYYDSYDADIWIRFDPTRQQFYRTSEPGSPVWMDDDQIEKIWASGRKPSGIPTQSLFEVNVAIQNSFSGGEVRVDDVSHSAPYNVTWNLTSPNHTITAISPQSYDNGTYFFSSWSDGKPQSHLLDVASDYGTFTASFLSTRISGPTCLYSGETGTWSATASGGTSPYHYQWWYYPICDDAGRANPLRPPCGDWYPGGFDSQSYQRSDTKDFQVRCDVTDANQAIAGSNVIYVAVGYSKSNIGEGQSITEDALPSAYGLENPWPNPFNPLARIRFALLAPGNVRLAAYDVLGRTIALIAEGFFQAGYHSAIWNASQYSSGVYFLRLSVLGELGQVKFTQTARLFFTK